MSMYYVKNEEIIASDLNRTFPELFHASQEDFATWVNAIRAEVTRHWDEKQTPPKGGLTLAQVALELERVCEIDTTKMWQKDEATRKFDCILDRSKISVANSFFPNIQKAKDSLSDTRAVSAYDLYANPNMEREALTAFTRSIRNDALGMYSTVYRVDAAFTGNLRKEGKRKVLEILEAEDAGSSDWGFWLEKPKKNEPRTPRVSFAEVTSLLDEGRLKTKHVFKLDTESLGPKELLHIRLYSIGATAKKVLPSVLNSLDLVSSTSQPNNFPTGIARALYTRATDHIKDQREITIYDPSMGFGSRLLAALSLRDRTIHYVGTDPNTDNWLPEIGISRYEYLERVFKSQVRYGNKFRGTYICSGSEDVSQEKEFRKLKGKLDFVFTSPPYFAAEIYTDEETQSAVKFREYDEWRDNFLRPTLMTAAEWLRCDRYLAINIADVTIGTNVYPLENDTVEILQECGLDYQKKLKMVIAKSPKMGISRYTRQPSAKNFCVINGKWRKYEPIFWFYKP